MSKEVVELFGIVKRGIQYKPMLCCAELPEYDMDDLEEALNGEKSRGAFLLKVGNCNKIAVSRWTSPKRTRSYPYARIYDTLKYSCKRVTIIPIFKDEGADGERDFLQWDTIALMSLLGIYVIIGYYVEAKKESERKISNQKFDCGYIKEKIKELVSYHSDALHWNIQQTEQIKDIAERALKAYKDIAEKLSVNLHSEKGVKKRIERVYKDLEDFKRISRELSQTAQDRESKTIQPKEYLQANSKKAKITIQNFLGGCYYFTCDEVNVHGKEIKLIECKHGKNHFPSLEDVKDGLIKIMLYTNISELFLEDEGRYIKYTPKAVLKLTTAKAECCEPEYFKLLREEAKENDFEVLVLKGGLEYCL